jgi:hypothetical protein
VNIRDKGGIAGPKNCREIEPAASCAFSVSPSLGSSVTARPPPSRGHTGGDLDSLCYRIRSFCARGQRRSRIWRHYGIPVLRDCIYSSLNTGYNFIILESVTPLES